MSTTGSDIRQMHETLVSHARIQSFAAGFQLVQSAKQTNRLEQISQASNQLLESSVRSERALQDLNISSNEIIRIQSEQKALAAEQLNVSQKRAKVSQQQLDVAMQQLKLGNEQVRFQRLQYQLQLLDHELSEQRDARDQAEKALEAARVDQERRAIDMLYAVSREVPSIHTDEFKPLEQYLLLNRVRSGVLAVNVSALSKLEDKRFFGEVSDQVDALIQQVAESLSAEDKADIQKIIAIEAEDEWEVIEKLQAFVKLRKEYDRLIDKVKLFVAGIEVNDPENLEIEGAVTVSDQIPVSAKKLLGEYAHKAVKAEFNELAKRVKKVIAEMKELKKDIYTMTKGRS